MTEPASAGASSADPVAAVPLAGAHVTPGMPPPLASPPPPAPPGDVLVASQKDSAAADDARYRRIVENAHEGIATIGLDGRFETVNPELAAMLGRSQAELIGARALDFIHPDDPAVASTDRMERRRRGIGEQYELTVLRPDGSRLELLVAASPLFDDDGAVTGSLCVTTDITELKAAQRTLHEQALRDPLTGLPNRTLLEDRLDLACRRRPTARGTAAVMVVDIDDFKDVNDTLGHAAGDAVLRRVADQLRHALRPEDTVRDTVATSSWCSSRP